MKRYAELVGNGKRCRIKSQHDNIWQQWESSADYCQEVKNHKSGGDNHDKNTTSEILKFWIFAQKKI